MLTKRIIPCLDIKNGRVVKGVRFRDLRDVGDPILLAEKYQREGADELAFLDIDASIENRGTRFDWVEPVARVLAIPFSVGGGIRTLEQMERLLEAGADKISLSTAAVERPEILSEAADRFGSQFVVLSIDLKTTPAGYRVTSHGSRRDWERDAVAWAREGRERGAGEILLNVIDSDGTRGGYGIAPTRRIAETVSIPVIASGGAGSPEDMARVLVEGKADAALAASIFHTGEWTVNGVKEVLAKQGIPVRKT